MKLHRKVKRDMFYALEHHRKLVSTLEDDKREMTCVLPNWDLAKSQHV